jgi:hypothetical protein
LAIALRSQLSFRGETVAEAVERAEQRPCLEERVLAQLCRLERELEVDRVGAVGDLGHRVPSRSGWFTAVVVVKTGRWRPGVRRAEVLGLPLLQVGEITGSSPARGGGWLLLRSWCQARNCSTN